MVMDWTKHWEKNYGNFFWRAWVLAIARAYKKLLKNINLNDAKILELGSGSGNNSLTIARVLKTKRVTLVDSNEKALEISRELIKNSDSDLDVSYLKRNILDLSLNERYDIVHSEGLVEHFYGKSRLAVFKKHIDFCKQGGIIIIFVPCKSLRYSLFRWFCKKFNKWIWDEEPLSRQELYGLCRQFNLRILKEYTSPLIHQIGILIKRNR
jgi:2-polyprenyl-3-methyl-5-hydroxy-6-metoxy-1,4-benzoquinol methylase